MNNKPMTVHEVATLSGITIRTLHYYDEIGLLKPTMLTDAKYRLYTEDDLSRLQEILFFREVGFALKEIKELLNSPYYNRSEVLKKQLAILEAQRERIDALVKLVKAEISGEQDNSFSAFSHSKIVELQESFRAEILEKWGKTHSFKEFEAAFSTKSKKIQNEEMERFLSMAQTIFEKLALYETQSPACKEVQQIVQKWRDYISEHFYNCNKEMLLYLGQLYVSDERFSSFINRFGSKNLANFLNKAIKVYCSL